MAVKSVTSETRPAQLTVEGRRVYCLLDSGPLPYIPEGERCTILGLARGCGPLPETPDGSKPYWSVFFEEIDNPEFRAKVEADVESRGLKYKWA